MTVQVLVPRVGVTQDIREPLEAQHTEHLGALRAGFLLEKFKL